MTLCTARGRNCAALTDSRRTRLKKDFKLSLRIQGRRRSRLSTSSGLR